MDASSLWGPGAGVPDEGVSFFCLNATCLLRLPTCLPPQPSSQQTLPEHLPRVRLCAQSAWGPAPIARVLVDR